MGVFERLLEQHETERHSGILARVASWRGDPIGEHIGVDGFLPPHEAAETMGVEHAELLELVQTGRLEWRDVGDGEVWVRPAIVTSGIRLVNDQ